MRRSCRKEMRSSRGGVFQHHMSRQQTRQICFVCHVKTTLTQLNLLCSPCQNNSNAVGSDGLESSGALDSSGMYTPRNGAPPASSFKSPRNSSIPKIDHGLRDRVLSAATKLAETLDSPVPDEVKSAFVCCSTDRH
jgi:hypothetical protein